MKVFMKEVLRRLLGPKEEKGMEYWKEGKYTQRETVLFALVMSCYGDQINGSVVVGYVASLHEGREA
jgi:hypothetical protein